MTIEVADGFTAIAITFVTVFIGLFGASCYAQWKLRRAEP
jgi:hypothetical protein